MTVAVTILPSQQLAALNAAYRKAVARKRLRVTLGAAAFLAVLAVASVGAEVNLRTLFGYFGHFVSYFEPIHALGDGRFAWFCAELSGCGKHLSGDLAAHRRQAVHGILPHGS